MVSLLPPVEVVLLKWRFSSHVDSAFGMRSPLGGQLERQKLRLGRPQSSPEFREVGAGDRALVAIVDGRLARAEAACPGAWRVLSAYYGPQDPPVLPLHWRLGRVMMLTDAAGDAEAWHVRAADAQGRKGGREEADWVHAMRLEAERRLADAERAYAATRPPRKDRDEQQARAVRVALAERERERRGHYAGRTDSAGRVVFATPWAKAAGRR